MPLRQNEIDLIAASPDGAAKNALLAAMNSARLDDRFLAVNLLDADDNPASAAEKGAQRSRFISRVINYDDAKYIRAEINVDGFTRTGAAYTLDNDYTANEQGEIDAYIVGLGRKSSRGPTQPADPVRALEAYDDVEAQLDAIVDGTATARQKRDFILAMMKLA